MRRTSAFLIRSCNRILKTSCRHHWYTDDDHDFKIAVRVMSSCLRIATACRMCQGPRWINPSSPCVGNHTRIWEDWEVHLSWSLRPEPLSFASLLPIRVGQLIPRVPWENEQEVSLTRQVETHHLRSQDLKRYVGQVWHRSIIPFPTDLSSSQFISHITGHIAFCAITLHWQTPGALENHWLSCRLPTVA